MGESAWPEYILDQRRVESSWVKLSQVEYQVGKYFQKVELSKIEMQFVRVNKYFEYIESHSECSIFLLLSKILCLDARREIKIEYFKNTQSWKSWVSSATLPKQLAHAWWLLGISIDLSWSWLIERARQRWVRRRISGLSWKVRGSNLGTDRYFFFSQILR